MSLSQIFNMNIHNLISRTCINSKKLSYSKNSFSSGLILLKRLPFLKLKDWEDEFVRNVIAEVGLTNGKTKRKQVFDNLFPNNTKTIKINQINLSAFSKDLKKNFLKNLKEASSNATFCNIFKSGDLPKQN